MASNTVLPAGNAASHWSRPLQAPPQRRARKQLALGGWLALLVLTRPETLAFAAPLAVAISYGARSLGTLASLGRAAGPFVAALGLQASLNRGLTGEWAQAGAVRKLIWSAPFVDGASGAVEVLKNLVVLTHQAFVRALGGQPWCWGLVLLALAAVWSPARGFESRTHTPSHRLLAIPLLLGAIGGLALVCLNTTARFQNYRYAAPLLAMLVCAAAIGSHALVRRRSWSRPAWLLCAIIIASPSGQFSRQIEHFAQASLNIMQQQGEMARRLRMLRPAPNRVLVNDAGVIPSCAKTRPTRMLSDPAGVARG